MKVLVTVGAGFIGFFVSKILLSKGHTVVGLDNINDYYNVNLKFSWLKELGIEKNDAEKFNQICKSDSSNFSLVRMHLEDRQHLAIIF